MLVPPMNLLANVDLEALFFLVVIVLYGVFWLFKRMAETKSAQERQRQLEERRREAGEEQEDEGEVVHVADETQVQQFLRELGLKKEEEPAERPKQTPPQRPAPPPQRPPRRKQAEKPQPQVRLSERQAPPPLQKPAAVGRPGESRPTYQFGSQAKAVKRRSDRAKKKQAESQKVHPGEVDIRMPGEDKQPVTDRLAFGRLPPLQRAIVLTEVLPRRRGPHRLAKP